jgi:hypothetical protein
MKAKYKVRKICGVIGCGWRGMANYPGKDSMDNYLAREDEYFAHMGTHSKDELLGRDQLYAPFEYVKP